jgi:hypothetical protein
MTMSRRKGKAVWQEKYKKDFLHDVGTVVWADSKKIYVSAIVLIL